MTRKLSLLILALAFVFSLASFAQAGMNYKVKVDHKGENVTPTQAMEMWSKDKKHVHIVDVRTAPEYYFLGHPTMAVNVPYLVWTGDLKTSKGKTSYALKPNPNFTKALLAKFDPKTDTLIFMCRSGKRSCLSSTAAIKAGFQAKKMYNMLGGFEGDKVKSKLSVYHGQRKLGGWRNEGMPWTYSMKADLAYAAK